MVPADAYILQQLGVRLRLRLWFHRGKCHTARLISLSKTNVPELSLLPLNEGKRCGPARKLFALDRSHRRLGGSGGGRNRPARPWQ